MLTLALMQFTKSKETWNNGPQKGRGQGNSGDLSSRKEWASLIRVQLSDVQPTIVFIFGPFQDSYSKKQEQQISPAWAMWLLWSPTREQRGEEGPVTRRKGHKHKAGERNRNPMQP